MSTAATPAVRRSGPGSARGVTLIESLVALVVVSIGLLGVAPLFAAGLAAARSAQLRTHAAHVSADVAEQIRANPAGRDYYLTTTAIGAPCDIGDLCASQRLALAESASWKTRVARLLPDGSVSLSVRADTHPTGYESRIRWREAGDGDFSLDALVLMAEFR